MLFLKIVLILAFYNKLYKNYETIQKYLGEIEKSLIDVRSIYSDIENKLKEINDKLKTLAFNNVYYHNTNHDEINKDKVIINATRKCNVDKFEYALKSCVNQNS